MQKNTYLCFQIYDNMEKIVLSLEDRANLVSAIINSNIVGPDTEAAMVIRKAEEIGRYVKDGECDSY